MNYLAGKLPEEIRRKNLSEDVVKAAFLGFPILHAAEKATMVTNVRGLTGRLQQRPHCKPEALGRERESAITDKTYKVRHPADTEDLKTRIERDAKDLDIDGRLTILNLRDYGWPEDIDLWRSRLVERFARYAASAARLIREETRNAERCRQRGVIRLDRADCQRFKGICLYPVLDYPGWDDDRYCPTGLLGFADARGRRAVHDGLADELRLQQARCALLEPQTEALATPR